jgi:hypothetical protein
VKFFGRFAEHPHHSLPSLSYRKALGHADKGTPILPSVVVGWDCTVESVVKHSGSFSSRALFSLIVFTRHLAVTVRAGRSVREVPLTGIVSETGKDPALAGVIVAVINVDVGFPITAIVPSVGAIATVA